MSSGSASYTMIKPDGGTHSITASYSDDSNYLARTSAAVTLTVIRETPTLTLTRSQSSQIVAGLVTLTGTISAVNSDVAGVMLQFDIAGQNGALAPSPPPARAEAAPCRPPCPQTAR